MRTSTAVILQLFLAANVTAAFSFTAKPVSHSTSISSSSLSMKTIAVFGASGLTSSECVYQALKNGDTVIGLARTPENLVIPAGSGGSSAGSPLSDDKLTMIKGSVTNADDVAKVFAAGKVDGVIVGLGGMCIGVLWFASFLNCDHVMYSILRSGLLFCFLHVPLYLLFSFFLSLSL